MTDTNKIRAEIHADFTDRRLDWFLGEEVIHRTEGWVGVVTLDPKTDKVKDIYTMRKPPGSPSIQQDPTYRMVDVCVRWDHNNFVGFFDAAALGKSAEAEPGPATSQPQDPTAPAEMP